MSLYSEPATLHAQLSDVDTPHTAADIADLAIETAKLDAFAVTLAKIDPTLIGFTHLTDFAATNVGLGAYTDLGITAVNAVFLVRARIKNGVLTREDINLRINGVASGSYLELVFNGPTPVLAVGVNKILLGGIDNDTDAIKEIGFLVQGDLKASNGRISVTPLWGHIDGTAYTAWGALDSDVGVTALSLNVSAAQTDLNGDVYILETQSTDV